MTLNMETLREAPVDLHARWRGGAPSLLARRPMRLGDQGRADGDGQPLRLGGDLASRRPQLAAGGLEELTEL